MEVKIGKKVYNSETEPIMIMLSSEDKENLQTMPEEFYKYLSYPETMTEEDATSFMAEEE